jgi:hypothetical protein
VIKDAQLGKPAMKDDAPVDMRNKEAIKNMGDFKNQPKPPKLQLRNEEALKHMGDPSKIGPTADESKKAQRRGKTAKSKAKGAKAAKGAGKKAGARVVAADRPKGKGRVVSAEKPVAVPAPPVVPAASAKS